MDEEKEAPGDGNAEGQVSYPTEAQRETLQALGSQNGAEAERLAVGAFAEAVGFLRKTRPSGPWLLTAINPDAPLGARDRAVTARFAADEEAALVEWLKRYDHRYNIYFHPNPARDPTTARKLEKADVGAMAFVHVDVDPPKKLTDPAQIEASRKQIFSSLCAFKPAPTFIVDSGGGYQALWRLRDPVPVRGNAEDLERYNVGVARALAGDKAHDLSRLLRLPGTMNIPDEKKLKKGRRARRATVMDENEHAYTLQDFAAFHAAGAPVSAKVSAPDFDVANVKPIDDLNTAPELKNLPDEWKAVILHGEHPADPDRYKGDRSDAVMAVLCQMVRAGISGEAMFAVITDRAYKISEHILAQKGRVQKYAVRQIQRARERVAAGEAGDSGGDPVAFINRTHFAIVEGGKLRFYREEPGRELAMLDKAAFKFEFAHHRQKKVGEDGRVAYTPFTSIWEIDPRRRFYKGGFVLDPAGGQREDEYNLWRGFGVEPATGDWSLMRAHITDVLAAGDARHADYIIRWAAWAVQNPATPPRVALVFKGTERAGKGVFGNTMRELFGEHGQYINNVSHLVGKFNGHLRHCCLLFCDEAVARDDKTAEGVLKGLITEPRIAIEKKGIDLVQADNHLHVIMASNERWVVPAGEDARRFAVFEVPPTRKGDIGYFRALFAQLEGGGRAAMLHDLLRMDLGKWHPEDDRPNTDALAKQKVQSLRGADRVWYDILLSGELPIFKRREDGWVWVSSEALRAYMQDRLRHVSVSTNDIGVLLGHDGMGFAKQESQRPRGWLIPPLPEARERWCERRFKDVWPDPDNFAPGEAQPDTDWHDADTERVYP